jgi:hypothetical protein
MIFLRHGGQHEPGKIRNFEPTPASGVQFLLKTNGPNPIVEISVSPSKQRLEPFSTTNKWTLSEFHLHSVAVQNFCQSFEIGSDLGISPA